MEEFMIRIILIIVLLLNCFYSLSQYKYMVSEENHIGKIHEAILADKENLKKYIFAEQKNKNIKTTHNENSTNLELIEEYENMIGWLEILNTSINYPVLQTDNNTFYLYHDYYGNPNMFGSIFMDYRNSLDDYFYIIYGHNSYTASMFSFLSNYLFKENCEKYNIATYNNKVYELISVNKITISDDFGYWKMFSLSKSDGIEIIKKYHSESLIDTETNIKENHQFLILSTCILENPDLRLIVIFQSIEEI